MNKWISRKLLVSLIAVGAVVWSIHTNNPEVEGQIVGQGELLATAAISLISAAYVLAQGYVDGKDKDKDK